VSDTNFIYGGGAMARIIDLSLPITEDFPRWKVTLKRQFPPHCHQSTIIDMPVHAATHMDAPLHYVEGGESIDQIPLEMTMGEAAVVDLSYKGENEGITLDDLKEHGRHMRAGDFVLLRTDWPERMWGGLEFWSRAPYLTEDGARWLADKRPKAVGCDFPQDWAIRKLAQGEPDKSEFVVHNVFMPRGILNIEYLTNLKSIKGKRCQFMAIPLKLKGIEGSPVRAIAIEE
jgi:kynurenine formamidase